MVRHCFFLCKTIITTELNVVNVVKIFKKSVQTDTNQIIMKKIFHISMGMFSLISFIVFFYTLTQSPVDVGRVLYMMFLFCCSSIMFIMTQPRPRVTKAQKRNDDRVKDGGLFNLVLIFITAIVIIVMSSCGSRGGYGCSGRESWKHMERRINSGY